ncbi:hypothetical protein WSM22_03190 [Cytophagales bacterium WSM2-2]|nr:hypothetical protein WSM22_03190 [Cytophagales bacterium WSM2-2]
MINEKEVQSIVKSVARLKAAPMNETFRELGLTSVQLQNIQKRFIDVFHRTTNDIKFGDTIYSITEKLNSSKNH